MKKILKTGTLAITVLFVYLVICCSVVSASDSSSLKVNKQKVVLYGVDSWAEQYLSIPKKYNQKFQLKVTGATDVQYSVVNGDSVTVSSSGLIEPAYSTWYWYGGIGYSTKQGDNYDSMSSSGKYGKSVIQVTSGKKSCLVTVIFKDYAKCYADKITDKYIEENITSSMSVKEKVDKICEFVCQYNYSASASGRVSMIVSGGGDCWASTDTIIYMCEKLGIKAWGRNGNRDYGAGSGHRNAMVYDSKNKVYYEAEAGYSGNAPRMYNVTLRKSLFSYHVKDGGIEVYQYDGPEKRTGTLKVPKKINGYTVISIGNKFVSMEDWSSISLPDTIENIGTSAFNSCTKLKTINIPKNLKTLGEFAFTNCSSIKKITCSSSNKYFKVVKNSIYDKKVKTLLFCPSAKTLSLPGTVTEVGKYACYYNKNLKSVVIPKDVKTIGEGAFGTCESLSKITIKGNKLTNIGAYAFYSSNVSKITFPKSVKKLGAYALGNNPLKTVTFKGSAPTLGTEYDGTMYYDICSGSKPTIYIPSGNTTWTSSVKKHFGTDIKWRKK